MAVRKRTRKDYGFRHFQTLYKGDTGEILMKSKKGDEEKRKPLLLFCQGSLSATKLDLMTSSIGIWWRRIGENG